MKFILMFITHSTPTPLPPSSFANIMQIISQFFEIMVKISKYLCSYDLTKDIK